MRSGLSERERLLFALHLEGRVLEAGQEVRFSFDYRAPNRMLGTIDSKDDRRLAFDGVRLYHLEPPLKRLVLTRLSLNPTMAAGLLTQLFSPFVPEGYRIPLLPRTGVEVRRSSHLRAREAIELRIQSVGIHYLLRWPSLDFLEKWTTGAGAGRITVKEEHCDSMLRLCVPKSLEQSFGNSPGPTTVLDAIVLNQPLPVDAFSFETPAGYERVERQ